MTVKVEAWTKAKPVADKMMRFEDTAKNHILVVNMRLCSFHWWPMLGVLEVVIQSPIADAEAGKDGIANYAIQLTGEDAQTFVGYLDGIEAVSVTDCNIELKGS